MRYSTALILPVLGIGMAVSGLAQVPSSVPSLSPLVTEEGQHVVFDLATWQRRELAKRLPLDQDWPDDTSFKAVLARYGLDKVSLPEHLPVPTQVLPGIYLIGSFPALTYLIDCGPDGVAIIDPGIEGNFPTIISNVEKLGIPKNRIRWVLNTHAHFDHSGSDALFHQLGAKILIGEEDANAVEKGTLVTALNYIYGANAPEFARTPVDWRLSDGEELHLGNRLIGVIHTPGHTEGSSCFFMIVDGKRVLFSGDTVLYDNRLGDQRTAYSDNLAYSRSLEKLAKFHLYRTDQFRWDVLLPGHGAIVLDRAYMDVEKGWHTVELDLLHGRPVEPWPYATKEYRMMSFGRP